MSSVIPYTGSAVVILLFIGGVYAMAASSYGDWVRDFYAKRDRVQTLFGDDKDKNSD